MNIYVVHQSALFYLRGNTKRPDVPWRSAMTGCCASAASTRAHKLRSWDFGAGPIDLMVPHSSLRCAPREYIYHVWGGPLPPGAFLDLGGGLFLASPELCFVQVGTGLSIAGLVQLGLELCGTYRLCDGGFRPHCEPLTTVERLKQFVERAEGLPGRKKARKALQWVVDGSASPMESCMLARLCLPPRLGGYGCPLPSMNALVELSRQQRELAGRGRLYGDLYWQEYQVIVEYNGQEWHTGRERINSDARRLNALASIGLKPFLVTADIYKDVELFESLALEVRSCLGRHAMRPTREQVLLRRKLPAELLEQEQLTRIREVHDE